tara:strand:+ start:31617 stop:32465 length:849 start_codon:yes stop_codon:yes gene_type:complete
MKQQKYINYDEDKTLAAYFRDVRKTPLLTKEEEHDLALRAKYGDEDAIEELTLANLKFVVSIAKEYQGSGLPLSDLINEGNYGLIKAARKFDPTRGFRFISYAVWWVRQSILQSLNDNSRTVRLPVNIINKISKLKSQLDSFEQANERTPVFGEILNDEGDSYDFNLNASTTISLNERSWDDEGFELGDMLSYDLNEPNFDSQFTIDSRLKMELNETMSVLDERERDIIKCYYGIDTGCEPMTLEGVGDRYELTKERVRQIKEIAIKKLRHNAQGLFTIIAE